MKFKYVLYAALGAVAPMMLAACDDDGNDIPNVDITIEVSDATFVDGTIYATAGQTFTVDNITVTNNEKDKAALIPYADYYFDNIYLGRSIAAPFGYTIALSDQVMPGTHYLEITMPVYAVDKAPAYATLSYPVVVLAPEDEQPENGSNSVTTQPDISQNEPTR